MTHPATPQHTPKERREYLQALVHDLGEAQRHLKAAAMRCTGLGRFIWLIEVDSAISRAKKVKQWAEEEMKP